MFLKIHKIYMDEAGEDGSPSGYGAETSQTTETTTTTEAQGDSNSDAKNDSSSEGTQNQTPATDDKSKQTTTEDVTGYDGKAAADKPAEEKTDETPLELDLKGLEETAVADIKEFAKAHNLTKEQAQALVDKRKSDEDAKVTAVETYKAEEAKIFQKWETELKSDPDFGGDNFAHSVHNVNKLIREELPGLKNLLTTSGKRLPPSLMKDLNSVARKLYGETELVNGEKVSTGDAWKPTDFYKSKT